ncbi:hypothetical protein OAB57_01840 [Bacteriovoracaceae bacterium]|nr:hypothetical protein [Bacteriovoracaceae bacterium]
MTRAIQFFFLSMAIFNISLCFGNLNNVPPIEKDGVESLSFTRIYYNWTHAKILLQIAHYDQIEKMIERSIKLGIRYPINRYFKLGAFYHKVYGLRHDDDWNNQYGLWEWERKNGHGNNIYSVELTARKRLYKTIVGEIRASYHHNETTDLNSLKGRAGLTYTTFSHGTPQFTWAISYELYHPLNFSEETIYERWGYVGFLFHAGSKISLGPFVARKRKVWTTSTAWKRDYPNDSYKLERLSTILGLTVNCYIF